MAKSIKPPAVDSTPETLPELPPAFAPGMAVVLKTPKPATPDTVVTFNESTGLLYLESDPFQGHPVADWKLAE